MSDERATLLAMLSRTTPWSREDLRWPVDTLLALGWTPNQIRRGLGVIAQTGLSLQSLVHAAEISRGGLDETLDALVGAAVSGRDSE